MKRFFSLFTVICILFTFMTGAYAEENVTSVTNATSSVDVLSALNIIQGYEDGSIGYDRDLTRAEAVKILVSTMGESYKTSAESVTTNSGFVDVDSVNHWAKGYISIGVSNGFINGMGDGTFHPDDKVTYAQMIKMIVNLLGYESQANANGGYPNGYIQIASKLGVNYNIAIQNQDEFIARKTVFDLINNSLDIPIVENVSWTTNIYGNPIAEQEIKDGTGDSKQYHTLLTEYHDAYKVKGRIISTHKQGNCKANEVIFNIEYSDNFDNEKICVNKNKTDYINSAVTEIFTYNSIENIDSLLFTYADAIVKNVDDEFELVSITPYGKNDIVELKADNYEVDSFIDGSAVKFTISDSSSKTKTYDLSNNIEVYVNGIKATNNEKAFKNYVDGNDIGTVTFIDTPMEGKTSKDGKYDYIMIDYQMWAVVDSVVGAKIYFDEFQVGLDSYLDVDFEDEDKIYTFTKNGKNINLKDVKENDIALINYDVSQKLKDSNYVVIDFCDDTVSGTIDGKRAEDNKTFYTINDKIYTYVGDSNYSTFSVGDDYTFFLDSTGRVVKYDETASAKNFGIIDRVYYDNNAGEDKVRIINADGTRTSYILKSDAKGKAAKIAYGSETAKDGTLLKLENRVVAYKVNSKNEAHSFVEVSVSEETDEFKESSAKIGAAKMNDATQIIDLTTVANKGDVNNASTYAAADIKDGSLSTFVDGEEYTVLYGDKSTDGTYKIVIVLNGNSSISVTTHFAVVDTTGTGINDGTEVTQITMFNADSKGELVTLYADEDETVPSLSRGDVIVYGLNKDNTIKDISVLFNTKNNVDDCGIAYNTAYGLCSQPNTLTSVGTKYDNFYFNSNVAEWDKSDRETTNGYARVGFGAIVDRTSRGVTIAKIAKASEEIDTIAEGHYYSAGDMIQEFSLDDVNVYVYDMNEKDKTNGNRVTVGAAGSIAKTAIPRAYKIDIEIDGKTVDGYDWTSIDENAEIHYSNYALFKTVNNEITDILVIIPNNN